MTTREEWLALAEKCAEAEGPSFGLDLDIGLAAGVSTSLALPYTASLDAVTGLIAQALPGWHWEAGADRSAMMRAPDTPPRRTLAIDDICIWKSASPALALCEAFCRAMAEKAGAPGRD